MGSERVTVGKSMYGGYYAQDSKGNIGRGNSEAGARDALRAAQNNRKNK